MATANGVLSCVSCVVVYVRPISRARAARVPRGRGRRRSHTRHVSVRTVSSDCCLCCGGWCARVTRVSVVTRLWFCLVSVGRACDSEHCGTMTAIRVTGTRPPSADAKAEHGSGCVTEWSHAQVTV